MSIYSYLRSKPRVWQFLVWIRSRPGFYWIWKQWFRSSSFHWQRHYETGGNSGPGSYGESASYKAELINKVITDYGIRSIIELGCGDGNQLSYLKVDRYMGLDISKAAIARCLAQYRRDPTRSFVWYDPEYFHDPLHAISADCAMSLDVLFHLVEDRVYGRYMDILFECGRQYVMIYALDQHEERSVHVSVRLRKYSEYIDKAFPHFRTILHVPPVGPFGDFYLYARTDSPTAISQIQ